MSLGTAPHLHRHCEIVALSHCKIVPLWNCGIVEFYNPTMLQSHNLTIAQSHNNQPSRADGKPSQCGTRAQLSCSLGATGGRARRLDEPRDELPMTRRCRGVPRRNPTFLVPSSGGAICYTSGMKLKLAVLVACGACAAAWGELSAGDREMLDAIVEPTVVGVPPAAAVRDMCRCADGEIRHYGWKMVGGRRRDLERARRERRLLGGGLGPRRRQGGPFLQWEAVFRTKDCNLSPVRALLSPSPDVG